MAWSSTDISAADLSLLTNDKPMIIVGNSFSSTSQEWSTGGSLAGADVTDPAYPARRSLDRHGALLTSGVAATIGGITAPATCYFLSTSNTASLFDTFVLLNHNLPDITLVYGTAAMYIDIDDLTTFAGNTQIAAHTITASRARILLTTLAHSGGPKRYTGVTAARLRFSVPGTFFAAPSFGEAILGRRYQLMRGPIDPTDSEAMESYVSDYSAYSGQIIRYVKHRGRGQRQETLQFLSDVDADIVRSAHAAATYGRDPIVWVDTPTSNPRARFGFLSMTFEAPIVDAYERAYSFEFTEVPPFLGLE
jgi:hypothetical protein